MCSFRETALASWWSEGRPDGLTVPEAVLHIVAASLLPHPHKLLPLAVNSSRLVSITYMVAPEVVHACQLMISLVLY